MTLPFISQKRIIKKIHTEFDSAEDNLLKVANEIINNGSTREMVRGEKLFNLGFTQTTDAEHYVSKTEQIVKSKEEALIITYYKNKYPFNKFLTENELERICTKYNLIHAPISAYKGDVPDKNIREIEHAPALKPEDSPSQRLWCEITFHNPMGIGMTQREANKRNIPSIIEGFNFSSWSDADKYIRRNYNAGSASYICDKVKNFSEQRDGLFICAPKSNFDLKKLKKNGLGYFNISMFEIKDPIVYRYVKGGIQIITKWGLEAGDELVVNAIEN